MLNSREHRTEPISRSVADWAYSLLVEDDKKLDGLSDYRRLRSCGFSRFSAGIQHRTGGALTRPDKLHGQILGRVNAGMKWVTAAVPDLLS